MPARYLKPQTPLEQGTDYVYPVTTLDQVIGSDGSTRLNTEVESIKSDIATIETSSTAAHSYAIGQYLVYNNTLYKATKAISVGATLVVGNNIQATNVGTELKSLNDSLSELSTHVEKIGQSHIFHYNYSEAKQTSSWGEVIFQVSLASPGTYLVGGSATPNSTVAMYVTIPTETTPVVNADFFMMYSGVVLVKTTQANETIYFRAGASSTIAWSRRCYWIARLL